MPGLPSARETDPIGHDDEETGTIIGPCSPNVLVNGLPKARIGDDVFCELHPNQDPNVITSGSTTVLTNGPGAARLMDTTSCGANILPPCSPNVLIGD